MCCPRCAHPLPRAPYARRVQCEKCGADAASPTWLRPGDEVMVQFDRLASFDIARVLACEGPDEIFCELRPGAPLRLEEVIPVLPAAGVVCAGMQVIAYDLHRWRLAWVASVDGETVSVKAEGEEFQSSFFNQPLPMMNVRVFADPARRTVRSAGSALMARLKGDPFGTIVSGLIATVGIGMLLVVATVVLSSFVRC
jgi:hypothetical protein